MTAQIPDSFIYRDSNYALTAVCGEGLFQPEDFNFKTVSTSTACWSGYVAQYQVCPDPRAEKEGVESQTILRLKEVEFVPEDPETLPLLLYGAPLEIPSPEDLAMSPEKAMLQMFNPKTRHAYRNCPDPVEFTGGLVVARDMIRELRSNMGYPPPWVFREVHELIFEKGVLTEAYDRSEKVVALRERKKRNLFREGGPERPSAGIDTTFSLNYDPADD